MLQKMAVFGSPDLTWVACTEKVKKLDSFHPKFGPKKKHHLGHLTPTFHALPWGCGSVGHATGAFV